jgi:hypothetical protein
VDCEEDGQSTTLIDLFCRWTYFWSSFDLASFLLSVRFTHVQLPELLGVWPTLFLVKREG